LSFMFSFCVLGMEKADTGNVYLPTCLYLGRHETSDVKKAPSFLG
jgi:hypothetical protein